MSHDSQDSSSIYRYSVTVNPGDSSGFEAAPAVPLNSEQQSAMLLRIMQQVLSTQQRQIELLEEINKSMQAGQRQRSNELQQWKQANPRLARSCWTASQALGQVQADYLQNMTDEIDENSEEMMNSEFVMNEFVDRFGPRMAHLNSILQVLGQLSSPPSNPVNNPK